MSGTISANSSPPSRASGVDAALLPIEDVAGARERAVAVVVPEPVVDLLEVVEVADQTLSFAPAAAGALELQLECLLEAAPVQQPGERRRCGPRRPARPPSGRRGAAAAKISTHATSRAPSVSSHSSGAWSGAVRRASAARARSQPTRERHLRERRAAAEEVAGEEDHPQVEERVRGRRRAAEVDADGDQHRAQRRDPGVGRRERCAHDGAARRSAAPSATRDCGQHSGHVGLGMRKRGQQPRASAIAPAANRNAIARAIMARCARSSSVPTALCSRGVAPRRAEESFPKASIPFAVHGLRSGQTLVRGRRQCHLFRAATLNPDLTAKRGEGHANTVDCRALGRRSACIHGGEAR